MKISLGHGEPIEAGWRRIICELCKSAHNELKENPNKREAVHEARKSLKKIRAALRLVRPGIDYYKPENVFFRDLGRELAPLRDASARLETIELLRQQFRKNLSAEVFDKLEKHLKEQRRKTEKEKLENHEPLKSVARQLQEKLKEIDEWSFELNGFEPVKGGIRKVYKRGQQAHKQCSNDWDSSHFHQWRKRAKYLRYQLRIIYPIWPNYIKVLEKEYHQLTDLLGAAHDLSELLTSLKNQPVQDHLPEEQESLLAILKEHRRQLQMHALFLGDKLYAPAKAELANNFEKFWDAYNRRIDRSTLIRIEDLEH